MCGQADPTEEGSARDPSRSVSTGLSPNLFCPKETLSLPQSSALVLCKTYQSCIEIFIQDYLVFI